MSYFKEFCESIHKTKAGYVPDLLDLVAQGFGDLCIAAFIAEKRGRVFGLLYMKLSNEEKNIFYSANEIECQDAIDEYNQGIDDARQPEPVYYDPHWKYTGINAAQWDAGFSGSEFC